MTYDSTAHAGKQMHVFGPETQAFPHDLVRVFAAWRSHPTLLLSIVASALAAAFAWTQLTEPKFTARAVVAVDARKEFVVSARDVLSDVDTAAPAIDTQVELIRSRVILDRAVDLLVASGALQRMPQSTAQRRQVIDTLASQLAVQRLGLSSAVELRVVADEPYFAASAANSIAAAYIDYQRGMKQQAVKAAQSWLHGRADELRQQVHDIDTVLARDKSAAGLLTANGATFGESAVDSQEQKFSALQRNLIAARTKLFTLEQSLRLAGSAATAQLIDTADMAALRRQYASLENQQAARSVQFGPNHPQVIELNAQLADTLAGIDREAQRAVAALRNEVSAQQRRLAVLQSSRDAARLRLSVDSAADARLAVQRVRSQPLRQQYEQTLDRLQEVSAQATFARVNAVLASAAALPTRPSSPKVRLTLAVASAIGIGAAGLLVFVFDLLSEWRARPADVEARTGLPLIALIPELRRADLRARRKRISTVEIVPTKPSGHFAESVRRLRIAALGGSDLSKGTVVQFTSASFAEGKTLSCIACAQAAAVDGNRVLLIDADARRAALTEALGIETATGLMEVLDGSAELKAALVREPSGTAPSVLPLSRHGMRSHDLFASQAMVRMLEQLREEFDLIFIDSAPVLAVADALALTSCVDVVVLAARSCKTPIKLVLKAAQVIRRVEGPLVGIALTRVSSKRSRREPNTRPCTVAAGAAQS